MSGEKPFDPDKAQIIDVKALEAKMTPNERAVYREERQRNTEKPPNPEADNEAKKQQRLDAVQEQEYRNLAQEQSDREFVCKSLVEAMETKNPEMLDTLLDRYIKDQTAFAPLPDVAALESLLEKLAYQEPDTAIIDLNKQPRLLINTAYLEIPFADGERKKIAITVRVSYDSENLDPTVSFTASEVSQKLEANKSLINRKPVEQDSTQPKIGLLKKIGNFLKGR